MNKTATKPLAALLLAGLLAALPAGCASGTASSGASSAVSAVSAEADAAPAETPPSASGESTPRVPASPGAGENPFPEDGSRFEPFPAEEPPALPEGPFTPAGQADMDSFFTEDAQVSWLYHISGTSLVYQYRFLEDNLFSAAIGVYETDNGVYSLGTYRFLEDGRIEAVVWLPIDPDTQPEADYRENASPVYMTLRPEWPDENRNSIVITLLTLEDTSPDQEMERFFRALVGVPLPLTREGA